MPFPGSLGITPACLWLRFCNACVISFLFGFSTLSRFESLEPEMNNQASRVAVVNQIARQLMHSGHPSEKEIKAQQDKLNTRYVKASCLATRH